MNEPSQKQAECVVTPAMIDAGADAYYGLCDKDWEESVEDCIAKILRAAISAGSNVSFLPRAGQHARQPKSG